MGDRRLPVQRELMSNTAAEKQTDRLTAYVAFSPISAFAWCLPFCLILFSWASGNIEAIAVCVAFLCVIILPFASVAHLAMKPVVYAEGNSIIVIPNGGSAKRLQRRRRPGQYTLKKLPDGRLLLHCFPWASNLMVGGMFPSHMKLIPRKSDREKWDQLITTRDQHSQTGTGSAGNRVHQPLSLPRYDGDQPSMAETACAFIPLFGGMIAANLRRIRESRNLGNLQQHRSELSQQLSTRVIFPKDAWSAVCSDIPLQEVMNYCEAIGRACKWPNGNLLPTDPVRLVLMGTAIEEIPNEVFKESLSKRGMFARRCNEVSLLESDLRMLVMCLSSADRERNDL